MKWVNRNIASFGGDAEEVTIFGESAGAISVVWLVTGFYHGQDLSKGFDFAPRYFKRAIVQSTPSGFSAPSMESSEHLGVRFAEAAGFVGNASSSEAIEYLRTRPADELLTALPGFGSVRKIFWHTSESLFGPTVDLVTFADPTQLLRTGQYPRKVEIIIGTTLDEGTLFAWLNFIIEPLSDDFYKDIIDLVFSHPDHDPALASRILDFYESLGYPSPLDKLAAIQGTYISISLLPLLFVSF